MGNSPSQINSYLNKNKKKEVLDIRKMNIKVYFISLIYIINVIVKGSSSSIGIIDVQGVLC